ncbi:hypothetical protein EZS27_030745 [termite gut metagenome]|uniref:Uncharacterized protein n=1 Tax=termite gut metagenome TaxID=433724 RepID=A0A5J4QEP7_9ZZZZ
MNGLQQAISYIEERQESPKREYLERRKEDDVVEEEKSTPEVENVSSKIKINLDFE